MKYTPSPDYITHYNRGEPFRTVSDVASDRLLEVLGQLDESNSWGLKRFSDPEYLPRRLQVEEKIRQDLIKKGGEPELLHPIYFFLGNNASFEKHKNNVAYKINLRDIPEQAVSFTYGDSLFSMCEDYRLKLGQEYLNPLCLLVYKLDELEHLLESIQDNPNKLHIEYQLWIKPQIERVIKNC